MRMGALILRMLRATLAIALVQMGYRNEDAMRSSGASIHLMSVGVVCIVMLGGWSGFTSSPFPRSLEAAPKGP
jgi:hypothetical protein